MKRFGGIHNSIQILILGTVIIVPFIYLPVWSVIDFFYYPKFIALVVISCALLIILLFNSSKINQWVKFDFINKLLLVYFVLISTSLFFSLDPVLSIEGNFLRHDGYVTQLIYILLFLFARSIKKIDHRFIYSVAVSSAVLSMVGIIQYLGFDPFIRDLTRMNWTSAFSTFGNQNFFGSFLVLQIPFNIYIIIFHHKKWAYITYGITLLALLMTMTRSAWIGFCLSLIFILTSLWVLDKNKFKKNKHIIYLLVTTFFIIMGFNISNNNQLMNRFISIFSDFGIFSTTSFTHNLDLISELGSFRMFIWIRVLKLIQMRPFFGFGIENLQIAFSRYFNQDIARFFGQMMSVDKAHNDFLHIAVSSGIPSLIAYIVFLFMIARYALKRFSIKSNLLLFTSILAYLACLFFNISVVSVAYIYWIYLGLICAYEK